MDILCRWRDLLLMTQAPKKKPIPRKRREAPPHFVGDWVRALGRRQVDIVRATGMNEGYLSQLISGKKNNPTPAILMEIADAIGLRPYTLFYQPPPDPKTIEQVAGIDPSVMAQLATQRRGG